MLKTLKDGMLSVFWGLIASGIAAYTFVPSTDIDLSNIGLTIMAIPLFMVIGIGAMALYSLYMIVNLIEFLALKVGILDLFDGSDFGS